MRSRLLLIATATAALLVPAAGAYAADCPGQDLVPDGTNTAQVADATLCLINDQRAAVGDGPLAADDALSSSSSAYAADMVARKFFEHESPDGGTLDDRLRVVGYTYDIAGENIAWGEGPLSTPAQIVDAWMHSDGHRTNILDPDFRQIGLGIVPGTPRSTPSSFPGATYVTDFGTPEAQPETRSAPQRATLDARASGRASDPIAHYAVQRKHHRRAHRAHRRHHGRHARRHVKRSARRHALKTVLRAS